MSLWQRTQARFRAPAPVPVLTTRHCLYIARTIEAALPGGVEIMFEPPAGGFDARRHIVICPQIFDQLPANFIAFQMEQSVSPRWFEPPLLEKLQRAAKIVDYSSRNLTFLASRGISPDRLHHLPVSYIPGFRADLKPANARHAALFYGDTNNPRRQHFIDELNPNCGIAEFARTFGDDLYREMLAAKLVVNIHYYDGAMLETTRLMECLSLGCVVVSEESIDMDEYGSLRDMIDFVPLGDIEAMRRRILYWQENPAARAAKIAYAHQQLRGVQLTFKRALADIILS